MTRIFLASSKELEAERRAFEQDIFRRGQVWSARGYRLEPVLWESLGSDMDAAGRQAATNAALRQADVFVILVHTKMGPFSREEFDVAWQQFLKTGKPRIHTYFKQLPEPGEPDPGPEFDSVRQFLKHLADLQHWPNKYDDTSQLLHHFGTQLERLWASGFIQPESGTGDAQKPAKDAGERSVHVEGPNHGNINTGKQKLKAEGSMVFGGVHLAKGHFAGRDMTLGQPSKKKK